MFSDLQGFETLKVFGLWRSSRATETSVVFTLIYMFAKMQNHYTKNNPNYQNGNLLLSLYKVLKNQ